MSSSRANTPSKRVQMTSNDIYHSPGGTLQQLVSISDLSEKDLAKVYSSCFPKGSKFSLARCGCGYLHPFISIPSSSLQQILSNSLDHSFEKTTINDHPQKIIIRRTPQKEISVFFDAEAADKNKTLMQNIDEGIIYQRNPKINSNNLTANLVSLLGSDDFLGNQNTNNTVLTNQVVDRSKFSSGMENLIQEFENQIKSLREQLEHITAEKKLIEVTTNTITEKADKQSEEIEKLLDEKNQQRERIHQLRKLLAKYEELSQKRDMEKNEVQNELKKLKSKFESESAMSNDKLKNSLQEREFEIEKLRSQLTISNSVANQLVDTKQELERRDNELQILQQDLHNAQLDLIGKEKSLSLISVKLENEQDLHTRSKRDLQTLSNTIQKKEKENDLISQKLETERSNYLLLVEKYQNLEAKLKQDQKHLARLEQDFGHNESAMESLKKKYDKLLELKEDLEKQIKSKSLELTCREETFEEELHKLKTEYETKLKNIQETNHLFTTQIEKLRSESKELHSKEDQFSRIQNEVETKLKEYKDNTDDLELQIQVLKVKNQQKENELLETKLILEKTEMESREYEQKMLEQQEALVKNVFNLESDNSKQVTEIDTLKSNCIKFEEIIKQLEEDLSTAKKNYTQVVEEVNSLQKKLNDMREYTDDLENDISNNKTTIENQLFELNKEKEALGELKSYSESIIQQLKHEIQTKISTIDSLREIIEQKNKSAESLATEVNDLKKLIVEKENQLKAKEDLLQRKIQDLNGVIDSKSKEINLNQAELTELKSERHDLLVKYQEISRSLDQALETNKVQNDTIGELTEKIGILERDISKKQSSIDKQEKEIKLLRQEVVEKDTQYHSLRTTALSDLEHQLQRKNEEIENQKRNFDQDIYLLKSHLEESKTLFESKVELINELEDEISSLKNEAKEKEKEITSWLKAFENTKDNHEKEVEGLSCKINTLQEELMIKEKTLTDLEKDKLILGTELSNMEASLKLKNQELDELGSSVDIIDSLQQENERLKLSQLEQAEDMERVSSELLAKENELIDLQNEKLNLDNELDDLSKRLQELEGTNEENRATISLYAEQHESLSNELREKTKNIEVLLTRVDELKDSKSSLEEFIKGTKQDLENRIELVNTLEKSLAEKESEVRRAKEENLKEIATLEKKIVEKEEEIERMSLQAEKQKKNMTSKIQDLEESLAEKENKEKKLMGSYSETNIKISELSTKLESIEMQKKRNENEIERLMNDLIMKDSEINQMNEKNKGLVMEIADLDEKLDSVEKVKRKIEATCLQLEEQKSNDDQKLKTLGSECLDLKQQLASFENEITLLKHKLSLLEKNNSDLKQDLMNSLENAELLEQELKLIRMNFKKDKELLENQLINEVNERDDMIKELRAQLVADSSLRLELDQVKELSQKSLTLLDEQNEEVKKLQIEIIQYTNIIDQLKQENDTKLSEMSVNNQSQIEELENRNRELAEMKLNYQKLESMFFQMERDYRTLQSQDSVINRQLEEKCIQLQTKLEETIEPITNKEEELKRLTKENTEMKDQIVENKQITEKMEQEIERLLEQLTTSSSAGGSYLGSDSSLLSSNSNTANVKSNRTTQSPLKTSHLMQSATIDLKYLWKQLRSEIVRLKQKNVELAQQIMQVTRAREDSIVKYEKQLKSTMVDLMHYKKVAEEVEQLRLDNTRLTLTKKDSEELMNNLSIKLSTLEAEKQNLWRLQDQTRKELINLKENVIKLSEENERLSRIESKASNIANLELEKLKKEKRLLEEKLLLANDTSKTQKETSQLMNKIKEARITREKLEKLIRDQRHQIDEMDSANRDLKMKLQNFENAVLNSHSPSVVGFNSLFHHLTSSSYRAIHYRGNNDDNNNNSRERGEFKPKFNKQFRSTDDNNNNFNKNNNFDNNRRSSNNFNATNKSSDGFRQNRFDKSNNQRSSYDRNNNNSFRKYDREERDEFKPRRDFKPYDNNNNSRFKQEGESRFEKSNNYQRPSYNDDNRFKQKETRFNQRSSYDNDRTNNSLRKYDREEKEEFKPRRDDNDRTNNNNNSFRKYDREERRDEFKPRREREERRDEFKPKFKSTVVPFDQYKKQSKTSDGNKFSNETRTRSKSPYGGRDQQQSKYERKERSNPIYEYDEEIETLFDDNSTQKSNKGRENNTRFKSSIENQVDSYISGKEQRQPRKAKMAYIPANENVRNMMKKEMENKDDEFEDDFQDLTRVKKIDMKNVDKKETKKPRHRDVRDPMSDDLKWIDEDEYRAIHQKGMKKLMSSKNESSSATSHILSQARNATTQKSPNMPSNVTFVMDDSRSLTKKSQPTEEEFEDDDDVVFYGEEDFEEDEDFDIEEDLEMEEEEEEKPKKKGSKKVKKEQEEAPKIDILPDAMVGKYLKQIQKEKMSKNREFKSLPVVNGVVKEIFSCGLASKRSLKQAEYLQYFTSDEVSKTDEEAKSRNAMADMLSGNKVIEAQLKRQQVSRKTNKTNLVYNQPELRADMQVKDDVVNWVFKNYKMKYIGSIGLSKEDEQLLMKEQEQAIREQSQTSDKEEKRLDIDNLSKEELDEILEKEENLYDFYRRNFEDHEEEEETQVEKKEDKEEEEESESLIRKLYDISKLLDKCKGVPQVAFAGRSNVGKSSLINAITGRNNLKASEKPGQTKDLNFHRFGKHFCLVDMPGYGFAFTKDSSVTQKWLDLIRNYFVQSSTDLKVVFLLIDSRLGLKRKDMDMISFLEENNVPYQIVFTKCDLMYVDDLARMAFKTFKVDPLTKGMAFKNHIKDEETGEFRMIFVSSRSKTGVARLKEDIVLRHSKFDVESWKKNVKKNVVLFV